MAQDRRHQPYRHTGQYRQGTPKSKMLDFNIYGIFFTCEFEPSAVREAKNLLSKHLDQTQPAASAGGDADEAGGELDIADQLKAACAEATKPADARAFHQVPTGIKHCLFFRTPRLDREQVPDFVEKFVSDCQANQQSRYLLRALPIENISPVASDEVIPRLRPIIQRFFATPPNESFAVDFKKRYNDDYDRQQAFDIVCDLVKEAAPEAKVNLTAPDVTVFFHVVRKAVLLGAARNFNQKRKYNLQPGAQAENVNAD